jgi:hypothetical protein
MYVNSPEQVRAKLEAARGAIVGLIPHPSAASGRVETAYSVALVGGVAIIFFATVASVNDILRRRALGRITRREAILTHALHAPVILMLGLSFIAVVAFFNPGVFSGEAGLAVYMIGFWHVLVWLVVTFLAVVVTSR